VILHDADDALSVGGTLGHPGLHLGNLQCVRHLVGGGLAMAVHQPLPVVGAELAVSQNRRQRGEEALVAIDRGHVRLRRTRSGVLEVDVEPQLLADEWD